MSYTARTTGLLATLVAALAAAILIAAEVQSSSVERSVARSNAVQAMLISQLELETGLRGFLQFGDDRFLDSFLSGAGDFDEALTDARAAAEDPKLRASIDRQAGIAERWRTDADGAIARRRAGDPVSLESALRRRGLVDAFRDENARAQRVIEDRRKSSATDAALTLLGLVLGLSVLFIGAAYVAVLRPARQRSRAAADAEGYRRAREEFGATLQAIADEDSAQGLIKRHLERDVVDGRVSVLRRSNSDDRLDLVGETDGDPELAGRLADGSSSSCLAVRLGREHTESPEVSSLLSCEICGGEGAATCVPSVVGGEVIGSVLVRSSVPLDELMQERVTEAVALASPVLANLRSLAVAEQRAATDALTGLATKRACDETLRRMVAQSARAVSPLALLAVDLDHFKQVNDRFGHGAGDDVLAAVGAVMSGRLRASDFAGRPGGEEFIVLLPDTGLTGALEVAEGLREAIGRLEVDSVDAAISASVGVAVYPDHAAEAEQLMRVADRALYAAKAAGRNRVVAAGDSRPADDDRPARALREVPS